MKTSLPFKRLISTVFLIMLVITAFAEQKATLTGTIVTSKNEPAQNVSVTVKGTSLGTVTNEQGKFTFKLNPGNYTLVISHVGMKNRELPVIVESGKINIVPVITINLDANALEEVSVNADRTNKFSRQKSVDVAKMPLDNLENPQVYTSIGKELMQEQAVFSADDAIKNATGITTLWTPTSRAGDGGSYFALRGFPVQITMRNGLSGMVTSSIDDANLERLEVIKGPSGTLYGGSSMVSYGGLINRVTKKPYDTAGGEIDYSTGSYGFNRASIDYNAPLDSAKKSLFRLNAAYNYSNTFQDNGFSKSFAFDPSFLFKINDRLTLTFEAEIGHQVGTTPQFYFFNTTVADLGVNSAGKLNMDYKRYYESDDITSNSDNVNFFAQADYKISDNWKSQTSISTTYSGAGGYQTYFYILPANDSISRNVWQVAGNSSTLQVQQNFVGDFKIGHLRNRLVAGLDFLSETSNVKYIDPSDGSDYFDAINTKGAIPAYNNFNRTKVDSLFANSTVTTSASQYQNYTYSAYASDVLNITDNLLAMASLRVNHFTTKSIDDPTDGTSTTGYDQTTLSPKFGLVYQVIKDKVSLFGNYMNGFSNPGYYLAYDAASGNNVNKLFKAEQANQWEGGVKLDLFDGKLSGTFSYYDISVKDKVRADALHANAYVQDGTEDSKGVEGEVIANPFQGFNIVLGYSHNDMKMVKSSDYDNGLRPEGSGPANSGNLWMSYTLLHGGAKGLGFGFGGNYAGTAQVLNDTYYGTFYLPSYTIFNTGVFYNKEKYRLALNVNNLGNKEYYTGYTTVNPMMLRQVIASIAYRF